jgi:phosphoglucosamine mutase
MTIERKYFGTDGIRGKVGQFPVNAEFVLKLGWAVGKVLAQEGGGKVLIGKDTRISGYMFESALEAGLSAAGIDIHLLGPMPTPAIAYLTRTLRAQAGIVISASHNPYDDNGIKFFSAQGTKLPDAFEHAIEQQLEQPMTTVDSAQLGKAARVDDAPGRYIEFCKSTVASTTSLRDIKMVVDCANGATYNIAPNVFRELGAEVIELNTQPNGFNINDQCGSTKPEVLSQRVLAEKADLGIAFDGDGDRVIMVGHDGKILDGDDLLYIIAKHTVSTGVVGTIMSNLGLELALADLNIPFVRSKVGDRYVTEALMQKGWILGGEPSGHIICLNAQTTGDGIVAGLQVMAAMLAAGKPLRELSQDLKKFPQSMVNVQLAKPISNGFLERPDIKKAIADAEVQLNGTHRRILLRPSGTEPLLRVMVEGEDSVRVSTVAKDLADVMRKVLA